jgi:hypothetical protein
MKRLLGAALRILIVAAAGLVLGGLTSFGQTYLGELGSLANSIGGWTMLTFLIVWAVRSKPLLGAVLGVVAFQALNEGYGIVSAWRGFFYSEPFGNVWTLVGIPAGLVFGAAAGFVRTGTKEQRMLGTALLSALLLADGLWSLVRVGETTGPAYWIVQIVLGAAFLAIAAARTRPKVWALLVSLVLVGAAVSAYPLAVDTLLGG